MIACGAFLVGFFGLYDIGLGYEIWLLFKDREAVPNEYSGIRYRLECF